MTKNVMIRSFMAVVLLMMTTVAWADGATFKINEGVVDAATKAKMESNVTLMMSLFHLQTILRVLNLKAVSPSLHRGSPSSILYCHSTLRVL